MNINIDTVKLKEEILKLTNLNNNLKNRRTQIIKENDDSKEFYETKTSKRINEEFETFKKELEDYINKNERYISYLQKVVDEGYTEFEDNENKLIDEKISVDWGM